MDSNTLTDTCNFQFSGSDDDLLEVVELWWLSLPDGMTASDLGPFRASRGTLGTYQTSRGTLAKIEMTASIQSPRIPGSRSYTLTESIVVNRAGSISFPRWMEVECRALANQLSMWGVEESGLTEQSTRLDDSDRAYWVDVVRQAEASGNRGKFLADKDIPKSTYYAKRKQYSL